MRFRVSGVNWEGRRWWTAGPISTLAARIDELDATRYPVDGTVAGKSHDQNSPSSDHRPKPTTASPAVVRALDFGGSTDLLADLAEQLRINQDRRIKYVIHNKRLFTSYDRYGQKAWTWRTYTGSPHTTHVHVSILPGYDTNEEPWQLTKGGNEMVQQGDIGTHVAWWQRQLKKLGLYTTGDVDGIFGPKMRTAVVSFQNRPAQRLEPTGVIDLTTGAAIVERIANVEYADKGHKHSGSGAHTHDDLEQAILDVKNTAGADMAVHEESQHVHVHQIGQHVTGGAE